MPPSSDPTTALATHKSSFLTRQIRLLTTPLEAPQPSSAPTATPTLPPTATTALVEKINRKLASHNRLSFGIQSQRHVLEQVESLYWRDVLRDGLPVGGKAETVVERDRDFAAGGAWAELPQAWEDVVVQREEDGGERRRKRRKFNEPLAAPLSDKNAGGGADDLASNSDSDSEATSDDEESNREETTTTTAAAAVATASAASGVIRKRKSNPKQLPYDHNRDAPAPTRYAALRSTLTTLHYRRDSLTTTLRALTRLRAQLRAFEHPHATVQPNLVATREHKRQLEAELGRMRVLLVRVGGGIVERRRRGGGSAVSNEDGDDTREPGAVVRSGKERLESVLELG